ncbi:ABC transporter permease [Sphingobacterium endophyticum]|uniref:ABC transporter permease n=1 Tax=Sphingobacterium endophyticum TaxID=2546448 RepID=UPI0012E167AE|nr:FtsX-like permease family protein [Sphingobacterium endophyticum]
MIRNHFKTAWRFLRKNILISSISVVSLAIGICATLIIFLMLRYEYSFDKHLPHGDRVYRVVSNGGFKGSAILVPLIREMESDLTGIETLVPDLELGKTKLKSFQNDKEEPQLFNDQEGLTFSNENYFKIFPTETLAGHINSLKEPNQIVLTKSRSALYFPKLDPADVIGKIILYGDSIHLQVGAVVADFKENSDFKYDGIISYITIPQYKSLKDQKNWDQWTSYNGGNQCLLLLKKGTNTNAIEKTIAGILSKNKKKEDGAWEDKFELQPLKDVHFNSTYNYNAVKSSTLRNLILLAIFLLLLGAINFINLSTAQSSERAKEIGIRKTLGGKKSSLVRQFLLETFLVAGFATLLSILLLPILVHAFEGFLPKGFTVNSIPILELIGYLTIQLIVITCIAGFYPAWVLTGYSPVMALKNQATKNSNLSRSAWIRKGLTIFQFVLAQGFLIAVLVVSKQIHYAVNMDMGFNKDAVITIYIPEFDKKAVGKTFRDELLKIPEVKAASFGNQSPAFNGWMTSSMQYDQAKTEDKSVTFDARNGDEYFLDVYGIPLVAGRNARILDTLSESMINERMLGTLGLKSPEDAIGTTLNNGQITIVGVMKNFNVSSAHEPVKPTMYWTRKDGYIVHVALDKNHPESWKNGISKIEKQFKNFYPEDTFNYKFIDEMIAGFYKNEQNLSKLLTWAVWLSISIASLGLFGLAVFITNQRIKEIGIRKVLGATISQIVFLLLKNLLLLVLIASLIAFPIAWYFMNEWLNDFEYKTELSFWIFILAGIGLTAVATLVLTSRTYFAAKANPVDSLRDE